MNQCNHKEWIGKPVGSVTTHWQCIDCGVTMTSGEMIIYEKLCQLKAHQPHNHCDPLIGLRAAVEELKQFNEMYEKDRSRKNLGYMALAHKCVVQMAVSLIDRTPPHNHDVSDKT